MTSAIGVLDVTSYLTANGWRLEPQGWRGAQVWTSDGDEVLVPPSGVGDADLRIRELITDLAAVERRDPSEVAVDVASGLVDRATYRMLPSEDGPATALPAGARVVEGVRGAVRAAARTVVEGPHHSFHGHAPEPVVRLLRSIRLGTTGGTAFGLVLAFPVVPAGDDLSRSVVVQLHDATTSVGDALDGDDLGPVTAAGVSEDFCSALSDLAGDDRAAPFELEFRWAHGVRARVPRRTLAFPAGSGAGIRRIGRRLGHPDPAGPITVEGRVESLHDRPDGDRWRALIRGDLSTARAVTRDRAVWVRLPGPTLYDVAVTAHRNGRRVRVTGHDERSGTRHGLAVPPEGLTVVDDAPGSHHTDRGPTP